MGLLRPRTPSGSCLTTFYNCKYYTDWACQCPKWTAQGEEYCSEHKEAMRKISNLEAEINDVIKKAREK